MKKLYYLDESEKERILNLHESRTKKQYLMNEQELGEDVASTAWATGKGAGQGALIGTAVGLGIPPLELISIPVGAIIGGAVGLISSISSSMGRDPFISTVTQVCVSGGKAKMGVSELMDIAKKLNDLINTTNIIGSGYATTQSREGIKNTLTTIPTIPDLCGVMEQYKKLYQIDLLADLKREIYYDKYWQGTVVFPLSKAIEVSKEATDKAKEQKLAETLTGWDNFPCVRNGKKVSLKDGSVAYDLNNFYYYGNGRKMNKSNSQMSNYHCGADGSIKEGPKPAGGSSGTGGGGTGGSNLSARVSAIQTKLGLTQSGKMDQPTINALMTKLQSGGSSTNNTQTTPQSNVATGN